MRIGSIVLATDQGLGYMAREFYRNGVIDRVYVHKHSSRTNHYDWYKDEDRCTSVQSLLEHCDTFLFFEEVFDWSIIPNARARGKKTVLMPMYECTRSPLPYQPDLIIAPSLLDQLHFGGSEHIPVPVEVPWKERTRAKVFVHNAGNGGLGGRNGTRELLEAMKYVKSPIQLIVRSQVALVNLPRDPRITYEIGQKPVDKLWTTGDVFVFPEKFNGLSLPLQEAYASGMLVMCGNRFPMNTWLPTEPMIPVQKYTKERIALQFDSAVYNPRDIAATIDAWYDTDITAFSHRGREWAEQNSWQKLKPLYQQLFTTTGRGDGLSNSH